MPNVDVRIGEGEAHLIKKAIEFGRLVERGDLPEPDADQWLRDVVAYAFPDNDE